MKLSNLMVMITTAFILVSGAVQAQETNKHNPHNQNFLSKRPYHEPVTNNVNKSNDEFEGATLERDEITEKELARVKTLKVLRMHQLSRRGYHEAN